VVTKAGGLREEQGVRLKGAVLALQMEEGAKRKEIQVASEMGADKQARSPLELGKEHSLLTPWF
jgi:hypothetical protein